MPTNPYEFLDTKSRFYRRWLETWRMNERRAFGHVVDDLMPFVGESDARYKLRQNRATYTNFMHAHAAAVTGQLRLQGAPAPGDPKFSMGSLGPVRPVHEVSESDASWGEIVYYSVDREGTEWPVAFDAIDIRAQHVGHRLCMIEVPPRGVIKAGSAPVEEAPITRADVLAGMHPYLLEFSPEQMTMHVRGQFSIIRVAQETGRVEDGKWVEPAQVDEEGNGLGYYLLVNQGCTVLGPTYERGGYWLFDSEKRLIRTGLWGRTRGRMPLWYHFGEQSRGTPLMPAESRSSTEGLGRVGVSLMDCMSARDWDAFDAAGSRKWFLNASVEVMEDIVPQWDGRSQNIGVPPSKVDGTNDVVPVTIYDDSAGAVAPAVFQAIIDSKFVEAREQSFQALTSTPESSGVSKEAGFMELKAPYLSMRASYRQQSEQNAIRFFEMRFGFAPRGYCAYERDYNLKPVQEDIDDAFSMLRSNALRSPTLEPELAIASLKRRLGGLPMPPVEQGTEPPTPEQYEATIRRELNESAAAAATAAAQIGALGGF